MSDPRSLIGHVNHETIGIVWLQTPETSTESSEYKALDYLLDGLLTASKEFRDSQIFIGKNFGRDLMVLSSRKAPTRTELESFISLLRKDLKPTDQILIIDSLQISSEIKNLFPKELNIKIIS